MVNEVTLIGYLGSDAEAKYMESGNILYKMNVATSKGYINDNKEWVNKTEWHNVNYWSKDSKSLKKGDLLYIKGELVTNEVKGDDGNVRYYTNVQSYKTRVIKPKSGESMPDLSGYNEPSNNSY